MQGQNLWSQQTCCILEWKSLENCICWMVVRPQVYRTPVAFLFCRITRINTAPVSQPCACLLYTSINILSVPQALLSVNKKEAFTSLFFHFVIQESLVWGFGYLRNNSTLKQMTEKASPSDRFGYLRNSSTLKRNEKWDESKLIPEFMLARNRGHFYSTPISLQCQYFRCSRLGSKIFRLMAADARASNCF